MDFSVHTLVDYTAPSNHYYLNPTNPPGDIKNVNFINRIPAPTTT